MNQSKALLFVEHLKSQIDGDASALDALSGLDVSLKDGYCLFNLYEQWQGAFSFPAGRPDALMPLLTLAQKVAKFTSDDTSVMYGQPEWKQLIELRGPVENVIFYKCTNCRHDYASMGISGFLDINGLICPCCGSVYFKSYYDSTDTPVCKCGAQYPSLTSHGCPKCGQNAASSTYGQSPYEYFHNHTFSHGPGA